MYYASRRENYGCTNYAYFISNQESEKRQVAIHSFFTRSSAEVSAYSTAHPQADQQCSIILRSSRQREREKGKQREGHGRDAWSGQPSAIVQGGIPRLKVPQKVIVYFGEFFSLDPTCLPQVILAWRCGVMAPGDLL